MVGPGRRKSQTKIIGLRLANFGYAAAAVDTAISGKLYTGMRNDDQGTPAAQCRFDDFIAEDITPSGGGISIPVAVHQLQTQGIA